MPYPLKYLFANSPTMKSVALALISLVLLVISPGQKTVSAQHPALESAVLYNDFIVDEQNKIGVLLISFQEQLNQEVFDEAALWAIHTSLLRQIDESTALVNALPAFEGNEELRDAAAGLLGFYKNTVGDNYKILLEIFIEGTFTDPEMETLNKILEATTAEEAIYDGRYQDAQAAFATAHGMQLMENELNEHFNE